MNSTQIIGIWETGFQDMFLNEYILWTLQLNVFRFLHKTIILIVNITQ